MASLATAAYDWVSAGLFVGTVLPMPGVIFGGALGLAIASRGRLGHRLVLFPPVERTTWRLVRAGAGVTMVGIPATMMLEKLSLEGGTGDKKKAASIETAQKVVLATSLLSLQLAGGALGYSAAWRVARRLKWAA